MGRRSRAQASYGPISSIPLGRSTHNFTVEANADKYRNTLAAQLVYWQEQGKNALNFQQAGFETAAQEYEQVARDEVHVASAKAAVMSGEMNSVAGDALENPRRSLHTQATAELQRHQKSKSRASARMSAECSTPLVTSSE